MNRFLKWLQDLSPDYSGIPVAKADCLLDGPGRGFDRVLKAKEHTLDRGSTPLRSTIGVAQVLWKFLETLLKKKHKTLYRIQKCDRPDEYPRGYGISECSCGRKFIDSDSRFLPYHQKDWEREHRNGPTRWDTEEDFETPV